MSGRRGRAASWAGNALLLAGALIITFAVLEIAVRLLVNFRLQTPTGIHDVDLTTKLRFLPHREHSYETTEFVYHASFNRFGRRDSEWPDAVVADPKNALFIGDSLTFGVGVEDEWTLPTLLETRAEGEGRGLEVFNFGMPAGAPPGHKLLLEDAIASGFAARTIIVGLFVGNDFYESALTTWDLGEDTPANAEAKPSGQTRGPSLLSRSKLLTFLKLRVGQSTRFVGWALTVGRWTGLPVYDTAGTWIFLREHTPAQKELFDLIIGYVGTIHEICQQTGRRLFVVVLPNRIQVENADALTGAIYDADRPNAMVMEYCREQDIPCVDLLPLLRETYLRTGEPLYYPIDRHVTAPGNALIADAIWEFLREEGAEITAGAPSL